MLTWTQNAHLKIGTSKAEVLPLVLDYHGEVLGGGLHQAWDGGLQAFQQLGVDGGLEEAVEVLAVGEAQEVVAPAAGDRYRKHDGVQEQIHQLLALHEKSIHHKKKAVYHDSHRSEPVVESIA